MFTFPKKKKKQWIDGKKNRKIGQNYRYMHKALRVAPWLLATFFFLAQ